MHLQTTEDLNKMATLKGGAAPALTAVIAVGAVSIMLVTAYKLYKSTQGEVNLGPGIRFKWFLG